MRRQGRSNLLGCLLAALPLLLGPSSARGTVSLDHLVERLKRTAPASERFYEVGYRRALKAPLITSGTYTWFGAFDFERVTSVPFEERARAEDGMLTVRRPAGPERRVSLARVPELQVLFGGLSALLSGDAGALARLFDVEIAGDLRWRLRLVPRDDALHRRVASLVLLGEGDRMRCAYFEGAGAQTVTLLGAAAAPPSEVTFQTLLDRHCPAP